MVFDVISSNIDEVFSINPAANVFAFGDFNTHHKYWLTCSDGADRPDELCYNYFISNDLTHIVNFPTWIPDSHSPALMDLFISSDASICSAMAFPLTFGQTQNGMPCFIAFSLHCMPCFIVLLTTILVLIGMVFVII